MIAAPEAGFAAMGLRPEILRAIDEMGYSQPTPIQAEAIPYVLKRTDVIGIAQTGTGKTASFTLPMLDILAAGRARARMPRSLILSPTRELATQTARNFEIYGKYLNLSMALLIGGVGMGDQEKVLEKGVDVLIATPGRLIDWFERGRVLLGGVEVLVIDEADRMFDMGFMPDVERIVSLLLGRKQTLLFSATMPPEVRRLADRFLDHPIEIKVAPPATTAATVEDFIVEAGEDKKKTLAKLIRREGIEKAIIFCNRKREIGGVMRHLQRAGLNARDLHGDLEQHHRQLTLDQFTKGEVDFLVATDVAARGLDVSNMPCVINYDVPLNPDDYVHRIGRTGRAGRKGRAFTMVGPEDRKLLANVERVTQRNIKRLVVGEAGNDVIDDKDPGRDADMARTGRHRLARPSEPVPDADNSSPSPVAAGGRRRRRVETERPAAEPAPVVAASTARQPAKAASPARRDGAKGGRGSQEEKRSESPVLGFGDDVPAFMLQKVPARLRSRNVADESDED